MTVLSFCGEIMFGQNPIRKQDLSDPYNLFIQEVFYTIQGEGPLAGRPAVFVRLAGCNLACKFCFVPSTEVTMGDFSKKRIDRIQAGDIVLSWDGEKFVKKKVLQTFKRIAETIVKVNHGDKATWCTPEHPFLVSGKGWVEARKLEPGDKLVHLTQTIQATMNNPRTRMKSLGRIKPQSKENKEKASLRLQKLWKDPVFAKQQAERMQRNNPMRRPGVAMKGFITRVHKNKFRMTELESQFASICEGLPISYVGDGKLIIGDKCPDFAVQGQRKLIEIWASDAEWSKSRGETYVRTREKAFQKAGFDTLFLPLAYSDIKKNDGSALRLRERVAQFISNGREVVNVTPVDTRGLARLYGSATADKWVYDFEVEDTHSFVVNGNVVHNCDTEFESGMATKKPLPYVVSSIHLAAKNCKLVVLTGGEPFRQDITLLIERLIEDGYHIQIETAGTVWISSLEEHIVAGNVSLVCSPKTGKVHPKFLEHCRDWKYIIRSMDLFDENDGLPISGTQTSPGAQIALQKPPAGSTVWLQPCDEIQTFGKIVTESNMKRTVRSCMQFGHRLCLQVHKIVGLP